VSFAAITLCVASQRVFIVVYFVIDSVRKLLVTSSYSQGDEIKNDEMVCVERGAKNVYGL
jgi:hypothetical protein